MTSRDFCYWLQGFFEMRGKGEHAGVPTLARIECIKNHLALVFKHEIDPSIDGGDKAAAVELQQIHDGPVTGYGRIDGKPLYRC